ncbi:MAG: hypothetical protein B6244_07585 [Candidatus Cloacimonetes bacterium 4572_55]|nr:MAG: hypothetical protein B6244_07585 [Candidatus Cloacimonetes bacterium 4572_55]
MKSFLKYWKLDENPFLNNMDQKFIFPSTDFEESLARILFNIIDIRGGLSLITGEVGCGKTTLSRALLQRLLKQNYLVALIANPRLSPTQLLSLIALEFGIEKPGRTKLQIIDKINSMLIKQYHADRSALLIIDEAQLLGKLLLEEIRLLTNVETNQEKLLQIVLFGQPELGKKINKIKQFKQRINVRYHIGSLSYQEMIEYVDHRLRIGGTDKSSYFTEEALKTIFDYTEGIPRLINTVCLNAMLGGMIQQTHTIDRDIIDDVTAELEGKTD